MNTAIANEANYLDVLEVLTNKLECLPIRSDRTGTGTASIFGVKRVYDISEGRIPLLSTKFVSFKTVAHELIWMLSGSSRIKYLKDNGVKIWDEWLVPGTEVYDDQGFLTDGQTSSIYGESWRRWKDDCFIRHDDDEYDIEGGYSTVGVMCSRTIDQIAEVRRLLKEDPTSRRIILNGWNVARIDQVKLPPCHLLAQFYVEYDRNGDTPTLSCQVYVRSNDAGLGKPYNMVQYATLTHLLATEVGYATGELHYVVGDCHLYRNHLDLAKEQLSREIIEDNDPRLIIQPGTTVDNVTIDALTVVGYKHHPTIKAPIAV